MTHPFPADTIAAIATPPGEAGIGIVRLSGPEALNIARRLFRSRRPHPDFQSHRLYLGTIIDPSGASVDEVLLTVMRAPFTYTREDVVEIQCHSGYGVLARILALALDSGARLARPGEFTLRAFISGRIDLTQAEAVLELIQARTATSLQVASDHLAGSLGRILGPAREALLDILARVEGALDFPEEAEELPAEGLREELGAVLTTLKRLAATYQEGRLLREGLLVVIAGRPNVGKSSLLNCLLDMDRAIVTEVPGTTRDLVEETITLGGVLVRFSDTAGLRPALDRVEELGIARTRQRLGQADLVLYLVDGSLPLDSADREALAELAPRRGLAVINKIDLPQRLEEEELKEAAPFALARVSALTGQGVAALKEQIIELAPGGGLRAQGEIITQARHYQQLQDCLACLLRAGGLLAAEPPWELVALELKEALGALDAITGKDVGDDVLDRIFSQFCLGK